MRVGQVLQTAIATSLPQAGRVSVAPPLPPVYLLLSMTKVCSTSLMVAMVMCYLVVALSQECYNVC